MSSSVFVDGPIPEELVGGLKQDFTPAELVDIRHRVNLSSAAEGHKNPMCLWVVGPSAVGKSTITTTKSAELFGGEHNAVIIDGSLLRECHAGWCRVVEDGFRRDPIPLIHRDAWDTLKGAGILDKQKKKIFAEAVERKMHLIIPETAQKFDKVEKKVLQLEEAGYEQHLIALWAPRWDVKTRGESRQCREGKTFSMRGYVDSLGSSVRLSQLFEKNYGPARCTIMTTDKFPNMILSIRELQMLADNAARQVSEEEEKRAQLRLRAQHATMRRAMMKRVGNALVENYAAKLIQDRFKARKLGRATRGSMSKSPSASPAHSEEVSPKRIGGRRFCEDLSVLQSELDRARRCNDLRELEGMVAALRSLGRLAESLSKAALPPGSPSLSPKRLPSPQLAASGRGYSGSFTATRKSD